MLRFYADKFVEVSTTLGKGIWDFELNLQRAYKISETAVLIDWLQNLKILCNEIGLEFTVISIDETIASVLSGEELLGYQLQSKLKEIQKRISQELSLNTAFIIPRSRAKEYYENATPFGEIVSNSFPTAVFDIEEASKCFATARYTACVMHLMRCLEVALKAVGIGLSVANLLNPNWQTIINQANSAITAKKTALGASWKMEEDFYTNAVAHLFAVKNAWRNPTMHVEKKYTEEEAKEIFDAVKGFMRSLAEHLNEKGKLQKKKRK